MNRFFFLSLLIVLAGCQYDPYTAIYTRNKPKVDDLLGTYSPDDATRKLIVEQGHYSPVDTSIILAPNGTCTIKNFPDWWLTDPDKPHGGFDSGQGTWTVQKHQEWWVVNIDVRSTEQFTSPRFAGGFSTDLLLTGEKSPYKVRLIIGDPDAGEGMEFQRTTH